MKRWPGLALCGLAAAAWSAVIIIDTLNVHGHAEHDMLAAATTATTLAGAWLAIVTPLLQAIDRAARANRALAEAVTLLQLDLEATGPHRAMLRAVVPNGNGRHATPR